jgi:hypothetical protein
MKPTKEEIIERLRADPNAALTLDLSLDELVELRKSIDPYAAVVGPKRTSKRVEAVAMSITNLREDYLRRFHMTAIIGFLFTMHREWKVPAKMRRWTPAKPTGFKTAEPFSVDELESHAAALGAAIDIVKEARAAAAAAHAAAAKYDKDELVFTEEEMKGALAAREAAGSEGSEGGKHAVVYQKITEYQKLVTAANEADGRLAGANFVATLQIRDLGIDADIRMPATEKAARKHPNSRAVLEENPGWDRGILPAGQQEMPPDVAHNIILDFLSDKFEYNPDAHVRSAYEEVSTRGRNVSGIAEEVRFDPYDPDRLPLSVLLELKPPQSTYEGDIEPFRSMLKSKDTNDRQRDYNTICRLLKTPHLANVARYVLADEPDDPDRKERWSRIMFPDLGKEFVEHIPPQDTFHRFKYYCDARYEELRSAVESLYNDKPDLEFAIQAMKHFEGTESEVAEEARTFRDHNQNAVITDIKVVDFGGWTFLGEFDENRRRIDVHNDKAKLLQRILDRMDTDSKYGQLLMRQRVRNEKAKNIREAGPDHPGLAAYKEQHPAPGPEAISPEERLRLERAKGDTKAADELKFYEEQEAIANSLELQARLRALTSDEEHRLRTAYTNMEKAREMMDVPEDAIQVDITQVNARTGEVTKGKIHTRAVAMGEKAEDEDLTAHNQHRDEIIRQITGTSKGEHPTSYYPAGSRDLAQKAFDEGKGAPPMAGFAQDFLAAALEKEREESRIETLTAGDAAVMSTGVKESTGSATAGGELGDATAAMGTILDGLEAVQDGE